jgi:hypothetical protein
MQRPLVVGLKELVWRKGDERCKRSVKQGPNEAPVNEGPVKETVLKETNVNEQIQRVNEPIETEGFRQVSSKREEANAKINSRYLVGQATQNPFMPANNYVNDIEVQMNFLTPR